MSMNMAAAAALLLAAAPAPPPAPAPVPAPVPVPVPVPKVIIETATTMAQQPLLLPQGPVQVSATRIVMATGAGVGTHMHFWARYVYVESGEVEVTLTDSGTTSKFITGQMIVEPIGKWHSVKALADSVLIAVEQIPPWRCNTVKPPAQGQPNDC
jgi:quercetin dioxygenase-like cupin family protein